MEKRMFRIGELAYQLDVERFVVRFWERQFNIKPQRSEGGQRYYTDNDRARFALIKELLYNKGYTIAGAKQYIAALPLSTEDSDTFIASRTALIEPCQHCPDLNELYIMLKDLQEKLRRVKSHL